MVRQQRLRQILAALVILVPLLPVQAVAAPAGTCNGKTVTIRGTSGPDVLYGTSKADVIDGKGGDDFIYGLGGNDTICGSAGDDHIDGGPGSDVLHGDSGSDIVRGGGGSDTIRGHSGNDTLFGNAGNDTIRGGPGTDTMLGDNGTDDVRGGGGRDWCRTAETTAGCSTSAPTSKDAIRTAATHTDTTFEHVSFLWEVRNDRDLDSRMVLEFRPSGSSRWQPGAPAVRAHPSIFVHDGPLGLDSWGASALFVGPGAAVDLRATITDPDGGARTKTVTVQTRQMLAPSPGGTDRYVEPGAGGGSGTAENPFGGLQAAADAAQPGDIFHIAPGTYDPFQMLTSGTPGSPIAFLGPADGSATIDGSGTDRGIITLGEFNQTLSHVIVDGLTLRDGHWGVDLQHTNNVLLQHLEIADVDDGIVNRRGDGLEYNQTVCDSTITGRTGWPGSGIPGERGIDLRGTGNVVCYNQVQYFGDCISVQPFTGPSYANDVYGNDVSYCVDDGIEIDYNQANVRVWRNRVLNARMGVSVQPIRGGPAYIFRNEFLNLESVPIKMHNHTTGFIVAHNTGVKHGNGHGDNGAMWRNATFRNNVFIGTRYAFEMTTIADEGFRDFDFNAWGTTLDIGGPTAPWFKWDNVRYDRIGDLPDGVEPNGVEIDIDDLIDAMLPAGWDVAATPSPGLRLRAGAPGVNDGTVLWNLNDAFTLKGKPDMGAYERGTPYPSFGPRP